MSKSSIIDMQVTANIKIHDSSVVLKLTPQNGEKLPVAKPGQFVEVKVDAEPSVYLRRPISINFIDEERNELWLLIRNVGKGTNKLCTSGVGDIINIIFPLGNGFTIRQDANKKVLLVGGGVGVAPMLHLGKTLKDKGFNPMFLLGARDKNDLLQLAEFEKISTTYTTTEDGSHGEKGFVTNHSLWKPGTIDMVYCCGPAPMMKAVAALSTKIGAECEVSLENKMACGIGACLCCVEYGVNGNVCVCKEGPVFNIKMLQW